MLTRLPSDLRLATHKCVDLVMRSHFWSFEKDGGHSISSAMLLTNLMAFVELEL